MRYSSAKFQHKGSFELFSLELVIELIMNRGGLICVANGLGCTLPLSFSRQEKSQGRRAEGGEAKSKSRNWPASGQAGKAAGVIVIKSNQPGKFYEN
jgi:hypothetical protein